MIAINEGSLDRWIRGVVGVALLGLGFSELVGPGLGLALKVVALVPLVTALIGWCPLYTLLGVNTCTSAKR